ncbi:alpha/beta hydrolase [Luteibacter aegosomatissinici]|uniref:alpha/beta hydrolase n=1 Tax=Luteibacter aegosomatissinici TaxID=2911539 RepID=UPI001FFBE3EB|nr:phospholipase [Luteibacter aegosomatissinici]UPG96530.1 phospholipase [Luteibacter aegosomatissinici]
MSQFDTLIEGRYPLALRLHVPEGAKRLLVMLHGVGGNEGNLATLAEQAPGDMAVALVRGPLVIGPGQFAWFRVSFTPQGPRIMPEEAERSRQLLIATMDQLRAELQPAAGATTVAGFSQGGIMSASVALTSPTTTASFAILAGRILPEIAPLIAPHASLRSTRGFVGHGRFDQKLPVAWAERSRKLLEQLEVAHDVRLYPTEHVLGAEMAGDFWRWVGG